MILPTPRLVLLAALLTAAGVVVAFLPQLGEPWIGLAAVMAGVAAMDGMFAWRQPAPTGHRIVPGSLALGAGHDAGLRLSNGGRAALTLAVYDHHPGTMHAEGLPQTVQVSAGGWAELRYRLRPIERGDAAFGRIELRITSPFGLWQARRFTGKPQTVRVYPDFSKLTRFAVLATDHRLSQIGVLQRRRRGEGLDFHQLREYREGDSQRQVDWKATTRMGKLISREYQDERDQQVVILLDCGRRMGARDGDLSHFDEVVNAALLMAYVSLRQGDAVGLMTMSGVSRWLAPRKSRATVNSILNGVYDLQPTTASTDYHVAAVALMQRLRKRALVVILSNLRDEDDDTVAPALKLLQSRHLVLFASLREAILSRALSTRVDTFDRAVTHAATADYLRNRELMFRKLERHGAACMDVEPADLPIALVNRYIDIKRSGKL
jgi:uncharacterized protein (DUF58 family)